MKTNKNIFAVLVWLVLVGKVAFAGMNSFLLEVQVSGQDRPSYILGVLSSVDPVREMPEFDLGQKIMNCETFALEYLPSEVKETIFEPAWKNGEASLKELVSVADYRFLERQMSIEMELDLDEFDHFSPGILANWLSRNAPDEQFDLQSMLLEFARANDKHVSVMADGDMQFSSVSDWPLDEQVRLLKQEIDRWQNGYGDSWPAILEAYRKGDLETFQQLVVGDFTKYQEVFLSDRAAFYAGMLSEAVSKGSVFAVVDARYFAGPNGLQAQLKKYGVASKAVQPAINKRYLPRWSTVDFEDGTRANLPGERFMITKRLPLSSLRPGVDDAECWMGGDEDNQRTYFVGSFLLARRENHLGRESYYKQLISVLTSGSATRSDIPVRPGDGTGWEMVGSEADSRYERGRIIKVRFPDEEMFGVFRFIPSDEFSLEEKIHVQAVLSSSEMLLLAEPESQFFNSLKLPATSSSNQNNDSFE